MPHRIWVCHGPKPPNASSLRSSTSSSYLSYHFCSSGLLWIYFASISFLNGPSGCYRAEQRSPFIVLWSVNAVEVWGGKPCSLVFAWFYGTKLFIIYDKTMWSFWIHLASGKMPKNYISKNNNIFRFNQLPNTECIRTGNNIILRKKHCSRTNWFNAADALKRDWKPCKLIERKTYMLGQFVYFKVILWSTNKLKCQTIFILNLVLISSRVP